MRRRVGEGGQELLALCRGAPERFCKEQILRGHSWQISMPLAHSLLGPLSPGWRAIGYRESRGQGKALEPEREWSKAWDRYEAWDR